LDELLALGQELGAPESDLEFLAKVKGELQQQRERIEGVLKADGFNEQMKKKC
jgi:hypothetical protein